MKFSWKALLFAPLLAPLLWGGGSALAFPMAGGGIYSFLFAFVPALVISYGATILLGLPCLYMLSKVAPLTLRRICALGAVLGAVCYVPLALLLWLTLRHGTTLADAFAYATPFIVIFAVCGLVSASVYWLLAGGKRSGPSASAL